MTTHAVQSETNSFRPRKHRLMFVSDGGRTRSPPKSSLIAVSRPAFDQRFACILFMDMHYDAYLATNATPSGTPSSPVNYIDHCIVESGRSIYIWS
jgi:hypothetical protein